MSRVPIPDPVAHDSGSACINAAATPRINITPVTLMELKLPAICNYRLLIFNQAI